MGAAKTGEHKQVLPVPALPAGTYFQSWTLWRELNVSLDLPDICRRRQDFRLRNQIDWSPLSVFYLLNELIFEVVFKVLVGD